MIKLYTRSSVEAVNNRFPVFKKKFLNQKFVLLPLKKREKKKKERNEKRKRNKQRSFPSTVVFNIVLHSFLKTIYVFF